MSSAARTTRSTRRLAAKACRGRHALCAGQERGTASDIDAAQDARTAGQAADHVRQRPAWTSDGVRPRRRQGNWTRRRTDPEIAKSVVKIFAGQLAAIQASIAALEKEIAGVHAQSPM